MYTGKVEVLQCVNISTSLSVSGCSKVRALEPMLVKILMLARSVCKKSRDGNHLHQAMSGIGLSLRSGMTRRSVHEDRLEQLVQPGGHKTLLMRDMLWRS